MRNIIIAGGGLVNKGAQAMTLICICELKKRYPDHQIILLAWDASPAAREKHAMYDLELLEVPPLKFASAAQNPLLRVLYSLRYGDAFKRADSIYRNAELFVDISGYALGSNWSHKVCNDYLDCIEHALAYDIPVYLLPQSFGPFAYHDQGGQAIDVRTRKLFPKAKKIFAREQEGYDALVSHYELTNVQLTCDMVLASKIEDYAPAQRKKTEEVSFLIPENSVCMIPSFKVENTTQCTIQEIYCPIIKDCLAMGMRVYICYHSSLDIELCNNLKAAFCDEEKVVFLDHDHSCMEFNELVQKFCFVVSSRFHAIVHALKNGVPCIALGWATKYIDLMKLFGQEKYVFDLREPVDADCIAQAVAEMNRNYPQEQEKIRTALPQLQKDNVFDHIKKA